MKLHEVTSPQIPSSHSKPEQVDKGYERSFVTALMKHTGLDFEILGNGMYATGVASKLEPGTVHRISAGDHPYRSIEDILRDPYFKYIAHIAKGDQMWSNPHFPKVYNIAIHKDEHENYAFTTQMERLHKSTDAEPEELMALGSRYIVDWKAKVVGNENDSTRLAWILGGAFESYMAGGLIEIKDRKMKQALDAVKEVAGGNHPPDMHPGNIMLRRSPQGTALVITDPLG